jgi:hypothetical protein
MSETKTKKFSTISFRRLSVGSVYKLWLIGLTATLIPLGMISGILGLFDFDTVKWNGQQIHGITALFVGPLAGAFVSLLFTAILGSISALGLWLYSKFRRLTLEFKDGT